MYCIILVLGLKVNTSTISKLRCIRKDVKFKGFLLIPWDSRTTWNDFKVLEKAASDHLAMHHSILSPMPNSLEHEFCKHDKGAENQTGQRGWLLDRAWRVLWREHIGMSSSTMEYEAYWSPRTLVESSTTEWSMKTCSTSMDWSTCTLVLHYWLLKSSCHEI